jgi:hypothetical protein
MRGERKKRKAAGRESWREKCHQEVISCLFSTIDVLSISISECQMVQSCPNYLLVFPSPSEKGLPLWQLLLLSWGKSSSNPKSI